MTASPEVPGQASPPPDAAAVVRRYWELMSRNDFDKVGEVLGEGFVCEWPQSNELIRGRAAFSRVNAQYPVSGRWSFEVQLMVAEDPSVVTDTVVRDDAVTARVVSFFTVYDGTIAHVREYWPDEYPAPTARTHLVEPLDGRSSTT